MSLQKAASRFLLLWRASILLASSSSSPSEGKRKYQINTRVLFTFLKLSLSLRHFYLIPKKVFPSSSPMLWLSSSWSMKTWSRTKLSSSFCRVLSGLKTSGWRPSLPPETSWWLKIISRSQRSMNAWTRSTNVEDGTKYWFLKMTKNISTLPSSHIFGQSQSWSVNLMLWFKFLKHPGQEVVSWIDLS